LVGFILQKTFEEGLILAFFLIILYWSRHKSDTIFLKIVVVIAGSQMIMSAASVGIRVTLNLICYTNPIERLMLFVGALAFIWNVLDGILKVIKKSQPH